MEIFDSKLENEKEKLVTWLRSLLYDRRENFPNEIISSSLNQRQKEIYCDTKYKVRRTRFFLVVLHLKSAIELAKESKNIIPEELITEVNHYCKCLPTKHGIHCRCTVKEDIDNADTIIKKVLDALNKTVSIDLK